MLIRTLATAILFAAAGPLLAAPSDSPLAQDLGKSRPLIIVVDNAGDPALVNVTKALEDPATKADFTKRNMVLYTVIKAVGERDGKYLDAQPTMALIRELKLGTSAQGRVILVGKDGEKKMEHLGPVDMKEIFATIDQMPMAEKEAVAPPPAAPEAAQPANGKATKATKAGKAAKQAAPSSQPDD